MDHDPPDHLQVTSPMIRLQSSDGEILQVEVKAVKLSLHIKEMLDDLGMDENELISIPQNAPKISGAILGKIFQWAYHHKDDHAAAEDDEKKEEKPTDDISIWDAEFLRVDQSTLFQIIRAANYLNVKGLLDVTCQTVANIFKGMTLQALRQKFHIQNGFSPDEEERVCTEYAWCGGFDSAEFLVEKDDRAVNGSLSHPMPTDYAQEVDNEDVEVMKDCLNNSLIVKKIFQNFSDTELLTLSFVNEMWNYEARSLMKERGKLIAHVLCNTDEAFDPCDEDVMDFVASTQQMNIVPYSGIDIYARHSRYSCSHRFWGLFPDVNVDQLQLKNVSVVLIGENICANCPGLVLAQKVLNKFSEVLEELSLNLHAKNVLVDVQKMKFPRLDVLKLRDMSYHSNMATAVMDLKRLVSRAPRLQQLYSDMPIGSMLKALQGRSAVIMHTKRVIAPFDEIIESAIGDLRLEKMQMFYTGPEFDYERFMRIAPTLLQASCSTTLWSMHLDAVLAVPLMCYATRLEKVEQLYMNINYPQLERLEPRILRIVKYFDFTRTFPKLSKVVIHSYTEYPSLLPDHMNNIIEQADAVLADPKPDRSVNIKKLKLVNCNLSHGAAQFFAEMFPNTEKLHLKAAPEERILFETIWIHWVDLTELEIELRWGSEGRIENLDSAFCGISPEEVAELRLKDEEYLKGVHIVPPMPSIACMTNLKTLTLRGFWDEPLTPGDTFMFSKVTGCIFFSRRPSLAVNLKLRSRHGSTTATSHLKSFASVSFE